MDKDIESLIRFWKSIRSFTEAEADPFRAPISEAAYYGAERRGFSSGYELSDWLAAENEVYTRRLRETA